MKIVFDYSVVLCKMLQRKSVDLLEAVTTAEYIVTEMKCLRQNAEYKFHRLYILAQDTAQKHNCI